MKDTLCEEEIHFTPYDAVQLRSILHRRAEKAFLEGVLSDDVIPLCAAFAAQDKGSARQAIRYLYKAGELASNDGDSTVTEDHVREAEEIIERKSLEKGIRELTTQDHLALAGVLAHEATGETPARTRQVYATYRDISQAVGIDTIEMRRVRDHLQELDLTGIVRGERRTTGIKGGPHYVWSLDANFEMTLNVLQEVDRFDTAMDIIT